MTRYWLAACAAAIAAMYFHPATHDGVHYVALWFWAVRFWTLAGVALFWLGWFACRAHHHPAIRDAGVERIHEAKILEFRRRESERNRWTGVN